MAENTRANLTKSSTWTRLIFIVLFSITFNVAEVVIAVITVVQFFTVLLSGGEPNKRLQDFGRTLGAYLRELVAFLAYESDDKPFPVGPWPETEDTVGKGKVAKSS